MENFNEKNELPEYELNITITRHGPRQKDDMLGQTVEMKRESFYKTLDDYDGVAVGVKPDEIARKAVSSPKQRAIDTLQARQEALAHYGAKPVPVEIEEKLSEGGMDYYNNLPEEEKEKWFEKWYGSPNKPDPGVSTGKEVAAAFSIWLLREIDEAKTSGGKHETDGTSHCPAMAAFILSLEEKLGELIISKTIDGKNRFDPKWLDQIIPPMGSFNISASSKSPDSISLYFAGKSVNVPLSAIRELAEA